MKKDIAEYVAVCDVCRRVKAEHQKPAGLLQPMPIPEWKWDKLGMDFITGLPRTKLGYDSIWVVVDRLTKVAHFILVKTTYTSAKLAKIYMTKIVCLHGVPRTIVLDIEHSLPQSFGISCTRFGNEIGVQYIISPVDRWTDRENQPDSGGHVEGLCARLWI